MTGFLVTVFGFAAVFSDAFAAGFFVVVLVLVLVLGFTTLDAVFVFSSGFLVAVVAFLVLFTGFLAILDGAVAGAFFGFVGGATCAPLRTNLTGPDEPLGCKNSPVSTPFFNAELKSASKLPALRSYVDRRCFFNAWRLVCVSVVAGLLNFHSLHALALLYVLEFNTYDDPFLSFNSWIDFLIISISVSFVFLLFRYVYRS